MDLGNDNVEGWKVCARRFELFEKIAENMVKEGGAGEETERIVYGVVKCGTFFKYPPNEIALVEKGIVALVFSGGKGV